MRKTQVLSTGIESTKERRERDMPEKELEPSVFFFCFPPTCLFSFHFFLYSLLYHFHHHPNDPPYFPRQQRRARAEHHQTLYNTTTTVHTHTRVAFAPSGLRSPCSLVHITGSLTLPAGSLDYTHILLSPYFFFFSTRALTIHELLLLLLPHLSSDNFSRLVDDVRKENCNRRDLSRRAEANWQRLNKRHIPPSPKNVTIFWVDGNLTLILSIYPGIPFFFSFFFSPVSNRVSPFLSAR